MRKSQIFVLSALGAILLIVVAAIVAARLITARLESGEYSEETARAARSDALTNETLDLSGFDRIDARGTWEISLSQGADWDVTLGHSPTSEDRLEVRVENGRLILQETGRGWSWFRGFDGHETLKATIAMPALEGIELSGASKVTVSGFSGETLEITASGATEIDGRDGSYRTLQLIVSGAGDVNLGDIVVDDARVVLSGAGDILLNMNGGELSGTVSGAGKIRYRGTVREENVVASGFSSVEALD
jgi:hypothetical protein